MTYMHERDEWPKFRWDAKLIGEKLAALSRRQGRLLGRMEALGFALREEAVLRTLTADVIKTSEIEGEKLDHDQVRSSLARRLGIDIGALTPADRNVEGIVEMLLDATQNYSKPLTEDRLFGWHASLFPTGWSGMNKIIVGNWRDDSDGPMQVVSGPIAKEKVHYQAPEAKLLKKEMKAFLHWYNDGPKIDAVLKAGMAHLWFVTIHPFADGNGRIARAIADMSLARSENTAQRFYSMSTQIRAERNGYYSILEKTQKDDLDITAWLSWFLDCLDHAFTGTEDIVGVVLNKAEFWERHAKDSINDRQRLMLNKLIDGFEGKLTSTKWATIAKCSQDTASRDIEALIELGILQKDPGGGRSTSYSLVGSK
jgi:Fic family protein